MLPACFNEHHPEYHPESQYSYSQNISQPVTVFESGSQTPRRPRPGHHDDDHDDDGPPSASSPLARDPARVLVLQTKHLDRPAEVVGVVDAHEQMGKHEAALWALKTKAARLGADAVVGVEFHHGEGEGEPTHLSGLAVRFLHGPPYPVE
jgi:hypothetical protein